MLPLNPYTLADQGANTYLPVRPRPYEDELAHGFLTRVAQANGYETPSLHHSAMRRRGVLGEYALRRCLRLTEAEWRRLAGPWPRYIDCKDRLWSDLARVDYVQDIFRWCPQCLVSAPYLRSSWSIKFCVICLEHGTYLLDACPDCHRQQRIEHFRGLRCVCGQSLTACESQIAPADVLDLQGAFLASSYSQIFQTIPQLKASAWTRLLLCVAVLVTPSRNGKTGQVAGLRHLSTAATLVQQAASIFVNWPKGFHDFLFEVQAKSEVSFSLSQTFGRLYRRLYVDLARAEFDFLRESFEAYLVGHWWGLICRRNQRIRISKDSSQRTTIKDAAKLSGASISQIKQLHLAGLVEATSVKHESGRQSWSIPRSEVSTLVSMVEDEMTLKSASSFLGIPKPRIRELVEAGLIHPRLIAGHNSSSIWYLSRSELTQLGLVKKTHHVGPARDLTGKELVPLLQVLKNWRLPSGVFPALMTALVAGEIADIEPRSSGIPLGQMTIPVLPLRAWLTKWKEGHVKSMSLTAAARILGVKEQVAYELVQLGLLSSYRHGTSSIQHVTADAIRDFQATYTTTTEASSALGISPRELLGTARVQPVSGPRIDGSRQYFFKRSDIEHPLVKHSV